ncbi:MAG: hypothetical protein JWM28_410 [Chitinophagaceae bacterium]|nr:hypothetical protein [Chitinophagaceae bacterium]
MKNRYLLTLLFFIISFCASAQIVSFKNLFQKKNLLQKDFHTIASSYQLLQLDSQQLALSGVPVTPNFELSLPFENNDLVLDLHAASIISPHFSVVEGLPGGATRPLLYSPPSFFQGKIKGLDKSFATISVFNSQLIGILSDSKSNIILGSIEENGRATSQYALYRDIDLKVKAASNCFTDETAIEKNAAGRTIPSSANRELATGQPIEIYFECDYKFYQDKGSNVNNVVNYVLSFFNSVALLYANENIQVQVSQIKVWTTPDPYASLTSISSVMSAFSTNMSTDPYVGDYAHFLSTRGLGGGIAYLLSDPCIFGRGNRTGVSAISNTYNSFPTYSWTVNVVTHELGHNFGSHHTHWCDWPGGPIDWCGPTANAGYIEGSCSTGPLPPAGGGTIMSYCHLLSSVGINLSNGFGLLPGNAIRSVLGAATCFGNCKMTISNVKTDASCGQNNGSATITPANGTGTYTYLWNNGQTGSALTNAAPGIYTVTVTDGAGCKLMGIDTIVNTGGALPVILTPASPAYFCTGNTILLSATNNPVYGYQWYNNNIIIQGAGQSTYTAASAGDYSVAVSSGSCTVTKSVTVIQVATPSASISTTGSTNFCNGGQVVLNANPGTGYQYQWYRDGIIITSATANSYTASVAGNYTVRVYSGTCESTSSPVPVTVASSPEASISSNGSLTFCDGAHIVLVANPGAGYTYQWYRNNSIINGATDTTYTATTNGDYTVLTSLGTCSKTSAATTVTVLPNPSILINPDSSTIQKYQTQTLTASGASTYNWVAQPGLVSSAANSGVVEPLTTTVYTIEGTAGNGCKGTAAARVIVIGCGDVTHISATAYSPSRVVVRWNNPEGTTGDSIQYRVAGSLLWTGVFSDENVYEIDGLTPGAAYEYRIIALCSTSKTFISSATASFTTPALNNGIYLKLFPNPVQQTGKLEIIVDKNYELQADIYNMLGQKVMNVSSAENLPAGQTLKIINGLKLSAGLYHLVVRLNGKLYTVKMIVQH